MRYAVEPNVASLRHAFAQRGSRAAYELFDTRAERGVIRHASGSVMDGIYAERVAAARCRHMLPRRDVTSYICRVIPYASAQFCCRRAYAAEPLLIQARYCLPPSMPSPYRRRRYAYLPRRSPSRRRYACSRLLGLAARAIQYKATGFRPRHYQLGCLRGFWGPSPLMLAIKQIAGMMRQRGDAR